MDKLVEALEKRRAAAGVPAVEFARRLGVSEATYSRVRRGSLPAGRRFIRGAIRAFPELAVVLAIEASERPEDEPEKVAV